MNNRIFSDFEKYNGKTISAGKLMFQKGRKIATKDFMPGTC